MKILWVNPAFLDYRIPVYKRLFDLTGGNFYLIYSRNRTPDRVEAKIKNAIGENAIALTNESTFGFAGKGDFSNTEIKLPYQPGLYKAISKVNADLIIGEGFFQWTPFALLNAKLRRKKFLLAYERTAHTERTCPKWRTLYRKIISKFLDGYSVNGQLTREYLIQLGIREKQIYTGGMSADSENLVIDLNNYSAVDREKEKATLGLNKGLTYLYVGQINERKGVIYLLRAWEKHIKKFSSDTLLVLGDGPLLTQFQEEFKAVTSIKLFGKLDYDEIYRFYAIADVFIIPTLEDNWSLVVPEAMSCGLPIACSIYNGCYPELIHEGKNGKLFDPLKEETVVETLEYFHGVDLKAMGEESRKIEKNYDADSVSQKIYDTFKAFIATETK